VDYKKAFDSAWHKGLWASSKVVGTPGKLIRVLNILYKKSEMAVRTNSGLSKWVRATLNSIRGDPLSPPMFQRCWKS
jgi:hypothetical protein